MTKRLFLAAVMAGLVGLVSCLDTEEKITINPDDSGTYSMTVDLGQLMKMAKTMGAGKNDDSVPQKKDTLILFKTIVDTARALTTEEKNMLRDGTMRIHMDEDSSEMKFIIHLPFKNISQLANLKENYMKALDKIKVMDNLNPSKKPGENAEENAENLPDSKSSEKSLNPVAAAYTFSASKGKISNKLTDTAAYSNIMKGDSTLQMITQMTALMGEMKYRTVIVLPKPAKNFKGMGAEASGDKKTIIFKGTLTDLLSKADAAEYEVEY